MNPNDPAFPGTAPVHGFKDGEEATLGSRYIPGLTKREYFAAMAMQGLLHAVHVFDYGKSKDESIHQAVARNAIVLTDALIAELSK